MERLTIRNSEGIVSLKCGNLQWSLPDLGKGSPIDRLAEYEDLEEQGLLLKLPRKPGSIVWICRNDVPYKCMVLKYEVFFNGTFVILRIQHDMTNIDVSLKNLGKTWFLTQAEAEEALKGMERENDETGSI